MLRITKAEEQAVRLIMRLAEAGGRMTLGQLADKESLPEPTVAKLLGQLRRGGVVEAIRGRHGGYVLANPPADISTACVLRALGCEPAPDHPCVTDPINGGDCPRIGDCGLRAVWRHLQLQVTDLLEGMSIADLLRVEKSVGDKLERLWPVENEGQVDSSVARAFPRGD